MILALLEYLLIGAAAGTMAGLLGIGGTVIIVPSLLLVFSSTLHVPAEVTMHFVVGTSLAATIATTLFSLRAQCKHGSMYWQLFKEMLPGIAVGTILGAISASFLDTKVLKILFGVFIVIMSMQMFFRLRESAVSHLPQGIGKFISTLFIGVFSGLLGISGGALTIPYLTYYRIDIRRAMAVSTACGVVIAFVGTISFMLMGLRHISGPAWSTGYVYWPAALIIALGSPWFATLGSMWSNRLPVSTLRMIFGIFLFAVGINMLF